MSDFVKGIVKLARRYRVSEHDTLFAEKRITVSQKKNTNHHYEQWEMVAYILDRFTNPKQTVNKKYTDPEYQYGSVNYHHIIDGINPGIGSQIINQKNSRSLLRTICKKLQGIEGLDKSIIHNSILIKSKQSFVIQEILATIPMSKLKHMQEHMNTNTTPVPEFEKEMQKLVFMDTPRLFFGQLTAIFSEYIFSEKQFLQFRENILKYFADKYDQWKYRVTKIR